MATSYDDLTAEQQDQVLARFTTGDPRAFVYDLGMTGNVLTRRPAAKNGPDRAAELEAILRDLWTRRASVDELGRGYAVHIDGDLCERIRRALGEGER